MCRFDRVRVSDFHGRADDDPRTRPVRAVLRLRIEQMGIVQRRRRLGHARRFFLLSLARVVALVALLHVVLARELEAAHRQMVARRRVAGQVQGPAVLEDQREGQVHVGRLGPGRHRRLRERRRRVHRLADRGSTISPHLLELLPGEGRARLRAAEAVPGHAVVAGFPGPSDANLVLAAVLEVAPDRNAVVQMLHEARQLQHLALRVLVRVRRVDAVRGVVLQVGHGLGVILVLRRLFV
mmetsp:Transcript_21528/g.56196  ORF Transcript_21528/g.56196 Transcript_21528/m.56196 type:complete len:239 (-) Transcript_21528:91-807(-)